MIGFSFGLGTLVCTLMMMAEASGRILSIRYKRGLGVVFLLAGTALLLLEVTHGRSTVLQALVSIVGGAAYLLRSYVVLAPNRLVLNAMVGPLKRTYPFDSLDRVTILENGRVVLTVGIRHRDEVRRLSIYKPLADKADLERFIARIDTVTGRGGTL